MKQPKRVHVVFKTHFDIGYTDLAQNVVERYMNLFFPKAIETAAYFEEHKENGSFIWTTGSWLIDYLLKHGTESEKTTTIEAIRKGHLSYLGLPFTTHSELLDPELLDYGISIAQTLDERFGKKTIAAKMTDVPGHTRSIITHLAKAGIKYLHVGVNGASYPPDVPEVFLWRNQDGSEIIVQYSKSYGDYGYVEGMEDFLYFAHTHDNHGPSSIEQIENEFTQLRQAYPDAVIEASTLDRYAEKLWAIREKLPVVEEEIGDSWIHGGSSDPYKLAALRELMRLKSKWLSEGVLTTEDAEYHAFCDSLIMVPEHTWGMDIKRYLADYAHYEKEDFQRARKLDKTDPSLNPQAYRFVEENSQIELQEMFGDEAEAKLDARSYSLVEKAWQEQRDYLEVAIDNLHPDRQNEAVNALKALVPERSSVRDGSTKLESDQTYRLGRFQVMFADDGSIVGLQDETGRQWADPSHRIGLYSYEVFSQEDYDRWYREYCVNWHTGQPWAIGDFGKAGMDLAKQWVRNQTMTPKLISLTLQQEEGRDIVVARLKMPAAATEQMGAPRELVVEYTFPVDSNTLESRWMWFDKDAHRLPEASWITFNPAVHNPNLWKLDKLGQLVSPLEVVRGGNRNMHAVNKGMFYRGADGAVTIETWDAAVVSPGERRLLQFDHSFANLEGGMHVNLHNNVWGTNFPAWYEDDALFRFKLNFESYL